MNGNTWVSKTFVEGSSPSAPARKSRFIANRFFSFAGEAKQEKEMHSRKQYEMQEVCIAVFEENRGRNYHGKTKGLSD